MTSWEDIEIQFEDNVGKNVEIMGRPSESNAWYMHFKLKEKLMYPHSGKQMRLHYVQCGNNWYFHAIVLTSFGFEAYLGNFIW